MWISCRDDILSIFALLLPIFTCMGRSFTLPSKMCQMGWLEAVNERNSYGGLQVKFICWFPEDVFTQENTASKCGCLFNTWIRFQYLGYWPSTFPPNSNPTVRKWRIRFLNPYLALGKAPNNHRMSWVRILRAPCWLNLCKTPDHSITFHSEREGKFLTLLLQTLIKSMSIFMPTTFIAK